MEWFTSQNYGSIARNFKIDEDFNTIRSRLLSEGKLFDDVFFPRPEDKDIVWRRPDEICGRPRFIANKQACRFDAIQGRLPWNCWLVAALELLPVNYKIFMHVVPTDQRFDDKYVGAFHFKIWKLGYWYDVVVDDRLPYNTRTNSLVYTHSRSNDVFWAALLEKAYAKFFGSPCFYCYETLESGLALTSMQDFTAGLVEVIDIDNPKVRQNFKELFKRISKRGTTMMVMRVTDYEKEGTRMFEPANLAQNHAYAVTRTHIFEDEDDYPGLFIVRLLNPYGYKEGTLEFNDQDFYERIDSMWQSALEFKVAEDGEFWMKIEDVEQWFSRVFVCHFSPIKYAKVYLGDAVNLDMKEWSVMNLHGEWVLNVNDGGSDLSTRHKNPQFFIKLLPPPVISVKKLPYPVVIEITQRSKRRLYKPQLAFYIYKVDYFNVPKPLTQIYLENHNPIDPKPNFELSRGRAYLRLFHIKEGDYCILPCTKLKGEATQFLVRVFSEFRITRYEDSKISKTCPVVDKSTYGSDDELKNLFEDVVQGHDGLEWSGLKEILNSAINSKRLGFGIITSFTNYIKGIFEKYFNLWSLSDEDNSEVSFTKEECRKMIAMLDHDHSGKLSYPEFINLWNNIWFWRSVYERHKEEKESHLNVAQLKDALGSMGYDVNQRTLNSLSYVYANDEGNICLTDFILCGVTLETVLTLAQKENSEVINTITSTLENWVKSTLNL